MNYCLNYCNIYDYNKDIITILKYYEFEYSPNISQQYANFKSYCFLNLTLEDKISNV